MQLVQNSLGSTLNVDILVSKQLRIANKRTPVVQPRMKKSSGTEHSVYSGKSG